MADRAASPLSSPLSAFPPASPDMGGPNRELLVEIKAMLGFMSTSMASISARLNNLEVMVADLSASRTVYYLCAVLKTDLVLGTSSTRLAPSLPVGFSLHHVRGFHACGTLSSSLELPSREVV